jgi:hypothetical protein
MLPSSSSTSSSEAARSDRQYGHARLLNRVLVVLLWTIAGLVVIDVAVGLAFRMPADARREASSLQNYFNYGRSIEGKLRYLVGRTPEDDAPIVKAGWLLRDCDVERSFPAGKRGFDIYGMSFSGYIADKMTVLDPELASRQFGGPAAPPNHSYACFLRRFEAKRDLAPIQIVGVLASSVRRMETISGLTTSFESPMPFSYPRYSLSRDGHLLGHMPPIESANDLRVALNDSDKWRAFERDVASNDYFYSRPVFQADVLDQSVIARMIRRAWGQRFLNERTGALRAADGFSGAPAIPRVLGAILVDFAKKARARGTRPIVILIEDRGYGESLSRIAAPALKANDIEFVATSTIVSPDDSANFEGDGHFTPAAFEKIARAVLQILGRGYAPQSQYAVTHREAGGAR